MIEKKCSKCGAELIMREGYGVCSKCGEIIGFDIQEKPDEVVEEILTPPQPQEEFEKVEEEQSFVYTEQTPEPIEETIEEEKEEDKEDTTEEIEFYYQDKEAKRSKAPIIISVVIILCILAIFGGYAISKIGGDTPDVDVEDVIPGAETEEETEIAEETPSEVVEESTEELPETGTEERKKEPEAEKEPEKEEVQPASEKTTVPEKVPVPEKTPAPEVKKPVKKPQQPKKEEVKAPVAPAVSYRIRISADDSKSQIGAFADLERAKAFATSHAAEGYKVFDMEGNLIFEP